MQKELAFASLFHNLLVLVRILSCKNSEVSRCDKGAEVLGFLLWHDERMVSEFKILSLRKDFYFYPILGGYENHRCDTGEM